MSTFQKGRLEGVAAAAAAAGGGYCFRSSVRRLNWGSLTTGTVMQVGPEPPQTFESALPTARAFDDRFSSRRRRSLLRQVAIRVVLVKTISTGHSRCLRSKSIPVLFLPPHTRVKEGPADICVNHRLLDVIERA